MVFGNGNKFRIRRSQSSYRREPRDRGEKGMPNCEGSYKRTMSPCRNNNGVITNCVSNGNINSKDIENIEPSASNGGSILSDIIGRFSNKSTINTNHQDNNNVIKSHHHHHHHHHNHHAVVKAGSFNNGNSNNHTALSNNAAPTTRGAANRYSAPVHHQQLTFSSVSTGGSSSSCSNESNNQISSSTAAESGSNAINNKNNGNIINNNNTTRKPEDNIQRLPPPPDYSQTLPRNYAVSVTSSASSTSSVQSSFTSVMTSSAYTENNGLLISGKPRNVRSPRTHSDPSSTNLPNNTNGGDSSSSCCNNNNNNSNSQGQDLGLRLLANSSETALSSSSSETMMPRSQSDLSTVGSVESGYSSLSLNVVPSPSSSPTRLSSSSSSSSDNRNSSLILTSFADSSTTTNNNVVPTTIKKKKKNDRFVVVAETEEATSISSNDKSNCCVETQCDIITSNIDERPHSKKNSAVVQRSELLVLRIGAATSDASCQTDHAGGNDVIISSSSSGSSDHHCSGKSLRNNKSVSSPFSCRDSSTSPMFRQKLQEEIDCEQLSLDLISHLSPNDKLLGILVPKPESKTSIDYVSGLFPTNMILPSRSRTCSTTPVIDTISSVKSSSLAVSNAASQSEDCSRLQEGRNLSPRFMQPAKSESSNLSSNSGSINCIGGTQSSSQSLNGLRKKKEELICRLDRKLNILREEQVSIMEECRLNEVLGNVVSEKVNTVASAHEASKFRIHVEEIGHITSLLLGLSGRLARVENTLLELAQDDNNGDRKLLESKRDKLSAQLEEAKALKDNIDRRSKSLSVMLHRYFTEDEFADYNYFVNMKSKLLIDSREIADKIQLGEEQLIALKETLSVDN